MKNLSKTQWLFIALSSALFVALLLIAAFLDLKISDAIYNKSSFFANFGDVMGTIPSILFIPFLGASLFAIKFNNLKNVWRVLFKIFGVCICLAGYAALGLWARKYLLDRNVNFYKSYIIFFVLIFTFGNLYIFTKIKQDFLYKLLIILVFFAIITAIIGIATQIFKFLFARQRYRTMVDTFYANNSTAIGDYWIGKKAFTKWYIPNSIVKPSYRTKEYATIFKEIDNGAFMSFPSGHTSSAGASFGLILIPLLRKKYNKYKIVFWLIPSIITILTGMSRVVYGAHFFSDIVAGGFLALGVAVLTRYIVVKKIPNVIHCFDNDLAESVIDNLLVKGKVFISQKEQN